MGFFYRRSLRLGPFRVNLGKSGAGWSVGGRGFRAGVDARGRRYTSASVPGTGVGYRGKGCLPLLIAVGFAVAFGWAAAHRIWEAFA